MRCSSDAPGLSSRSNYPSRKGFNWGPGSFFIGYHALLLGTLPYVLVHHRPSLVLALGVAAVISATGLTLTVLYHRCYSHRAFEIAWPAELVLLFFGTLICQGSVLDWAFDHRRHHKYVERDGDPHAITRGFWYAHILWIFERRVPMDYRIVHDLAARRLLRFQHNHYVALCFIANLLTCALLAWVASDVFGALYYGFLLRVFISHHATFTINSFCHRWGTRTYEGAATAVNNGLWSIATFGEGQHNYHHAFPYDYRIGASKRHWDPGKWFIWCLLLAGLASGLRRAPPQTIKARTLAQHDDEAQRARRRI